MNKVLIALLGSLALCACNRPVSVVDPFWIDLTKPFPVKTGKPITAVGVTGDQLYFVSGARLFRTNRGGKTIEDVTRKLKKDPADQVTEILSDPDQRTIWISLNGNLHTAKSYSVALDPTASSRTYLDQKIELIESLRAGAPQKSSISQLVYDDKQLLVAFFKGSVYHRSLSNEKYQLIYSPTQPGRWATSGAITGGYAFFAVPGDGLIIVDLKHMKTTRLKDKSIDTEIVSLVADQQYLYIGSKQGLAIADINYLLQRGGHIPRKPE